MLVVLSTAAAAVLVVIAVLLPPFSLGDRFLGTPYVVLDQEAPQVALDGLTVTRGSASRIGTVGVRLQSVAAEMFLGQPGMSDVQMREARAALPESLTLVSPVYRLQRRPGDSEPMTLRISIPAGVERARLDLYGYDARQQRWSYLPAHPDGQSTALVAEVESLPDAVALFRSALLVPVLGAVIEPGQTPTPEIVAAANVIHPAGLKPITSGALQGSLPAGIAFGQGYAVVPVIRNFDRVDAVDSQTIGSLLRTAAFREDHIRRLMEFVTSAPYQGLAIDYRELSPDLRREYAQFITALGASLRRAGFTLTVAVPFPAISGERIDTGAYDWRAIGAAADAVQLLLPLAPQLSGEGGPVSRTLTWAMGEIGRSKLQVVLSALSVQQRGSAITPATFSEAVAALGQPIASPGTLIPPDTQAEIRLSGERARFDVLAELNTPVIRYLNADGTTRRTVWLTTSAAFRARLGRLLPYNLAGVMVPDLAVPGVPVEMADILREFKISQAARTWYVPVASPPTLNWVVSVGQTVVARHPGAPDTPFIYTPDTPDRVVQISAVIVELGFRLGEVTIRAGVPTATPSPPTPTMQPPTPALPEETPLPPGG
jgi:hypothetical protein